MKKSIIRYSYACLAQDGLCNHPKGSYVCNCGMAKEDNEHFFLHYPHFNELRQNLLGQLSRVLNKDALNLDPKELCHLMLYGSPSLSVIDNRMVLEATIQYIENSERFK